MKQSVRSIIKYLRILRILLSLSNQKVAEYRTSFIMTTGTIALWLVAEFFWMFVIFKFTQSYAGYNVWQYIGFIGFYFFIINLFWFLFDTSLNSLSDNIYDGKIDMLILRPINSQFLATFLEFDIPSIFNSFMGLVTFMIAIIKLAPQVHILQILSLILITCLCIISFYSILFSVFSLSFWSGRLPALRAFLNMIFHEPSRVPTEAYRGGIKILFYFIIPVALVATIPTSVFYFGINGKLILYYTIFTGIVFLLSRIVWDLGLRSYSSVSS